MKPLLILLAVVLCGCTTLYNSETDPVTGIIKECKAKSSRRISAKCGDATVKAGVILVKDETIQVIAKDVKDK